MGKQDQQQLPENASHEIKKAYNCVIETGVIHFWDRRQIPGVNPYEVFTLYKSAFKAFQQSGRLAAERWAKAARHLSNAFWHEAKIHYLEPRANELPFLEHANEEYGWIENDNTMRTFLESIDKNPPAGMSQLPEEMHRYLFRARKHLKTLEESSYRHELLRAERSKAAYEYTRALECMALAYEAEQRFQKLHKKSAA